MPRRHLGQGMHGFQACAKCGHLYEVRHVSYIEFKPTTERLVKKEISLRKAAATRDRNRREAKWKAEVLAHTISFACPHCETQLRDELREGWTRTCPVCRNDHVLHNGEVIKSKAREWAKRKAAS